MAASPKLPAAVEDQPGSPEQSVPQFEPVPLRTRHDGWTADRQIAFIERDSLRSRSRSSAAASMESSSRPSRPLRARTCVRACTHMSLPPLTTFSPTYRAEGSDCAAIVIFCWKEREGRPAGRRSRTRQTSRNRRWPTGQFTSWRHLANCARRSRMFPSCSPRTNRIRSGFHQAELGRFW